MNTRRERLAATYEEILAIIDGNAGRVFVAALDEIAALKDKLDEMLLEGIHSVDDLEL